MSAKAPTVSAVVLAWRDEPWIERCTEAALASTGVKVDVVVVDNGCTTGAVERLEERAGVSVVRPGRNLGFAGGCNAGAAQARGEYLALVNADATLAPDALSRLAEVAAKPAVGIASASIRLADDPQRLNSAGNPLHYTGMVWAGAFGELAAEHDQEADVTAASGAGLVLRRALWEELGGFDPAYFAYHEDVELSWRCWQRGLRVTYVPDAVVVHRYAFSRNAAKLYLIERNRHLFLLTAFSARTLLVLAPALALVEVALLAVAVRQGWLGHKLHGWGWVAGHAHWVAARRRRLQRERTVSDRELARLLAARIEPGNVPSPPGLGVLNALLAGYWRVARGLL